MRTIKQIACIALAGFALALSTSVTQAQGYPSRIVRITSPFPAGLTPDVIIRVVADRLARNWGQQVVIEARPGANGIIAIGAAKKAAPDGHELLLLPNAQLTLNPHLIKAIPYDPENDFVPVSMVYRTAFLVAVSATGPYRSMRDLIAAARANPERITYSTPFVGSGPHLGGALLAYLTGTRMVPVHFKEGSQMFTSIINGDVAFIVSTSGSAIAFAMSAAMRRASSGGVPRGATMPPQASTSKSAGPPASPIAGTPGSLSSRAGPATAR